MFFFFHFFFNPFLKSDPKNKMNLPTHIRFTTKTPFVIYNCTGEIVDPPPKVPKRLRFSLNHYAPSMAVAKAKEKVGLEVPAFYTLLDWQGGQHVLMALPREAENGRRGNAAVQGVLSLVAWMRQVTRRRQLRPAPTKRSLTHPSMPPKERIKRCAAEIEEVAVECLASQGHYGHDGLDFLVDDLMEHVEYMTEMVDK